MVECQLRLIPHKLQQVIWLRAIVYGYTGVQWRSNNLVGGERQKHMS